MISNCGAGRREIRRFVGRTVQGIAPCVPSFYTDFQLREIKETDNCTPFAKWGVVSPESSLERNLS